MKTQVASSFNQPALFLRSIWSSTWTFSRIVWAAFFVLALIFVASFALRWTLARGGFGTAKLQSGEDEKAISPQQGFVAGSRERQALRRMLGRTASKRASIIRIVSSDPTSNLCDNPIQLDLDATGRRPFWPSLPANVQNIAKDAVATEKRSSSLAGSPNPSRRRKDIAARFGANGARSNSASPSPNRSALLTSGSTASNRPSRSRLAEPTLMNRSGSNASRSKQRTAIEVEDDWIDNAPVELDSDASDSRTSTPNMAFGPSEETGKFTRGIHDDLDSFVDSSPESSVFSLYRLPSILKNQAQTFRTASLREIEVPQSLILQGAQSDMSGPDAMHTYGMMSSPPFQHTGGNGGSMAPPPYSPSTHAMDRLNQSWSQTRKRQVKLIEPDWHYHVDSHIRARERLEAANRFSHFKRSNSVDTHLNRLGDETPASPLWAGSPGIDNDDGPEFWFERFTQSTAAAGRDWDWRKRRARLQRAAAIGAALTQTQFGVSPHVPLGNENSQIKQEPPVSDPGTRTGQMANPLRRVIPVAPLITFTPQELQSAPRLSVDTESGRSPLSKMALGLPTSPTPSGSGTPLGGIFKDTDTSHKSSQAAKLAERRRQANEDIVRSSISASSADSSVPTSSMSRPSLTSEPQSSSILKGVNRVMRRKLSASADASPSAETSTFSKLASASVDNLVSSPSRKDERSSNPSSPSPLANADPSARTSSLGSLGRKFSRNNGRTMLRRGSGSKDFLQDAAGIELIGTSDAADAGMEEGSELEHSNYEHSLMPSQPLQLSGFRSSADAYSPPASRLGSRNSRSRRSGSSPIPSPGPPESDSLPSAYFDSKPSRNVARPSTTESTTRSSDIRRSSESAMPSRVKSLSESPRQPLHYDNDSIREGSSTSSHKQSASSSSASPSVSKKRVKSGSRSSIMRSTHAARSEIDHTARNRGSVRSPTAFSTSSSTSSLVDSSGSRSGSVRKMSPMSSLKRPRSDMVEVRHEKAPDPVLQPEPAPRGMAHRARSASLSSNASSPASSRRSSRSNSIRDGHTSSGFAGITSLAMTSSIPGSPVDERKTDSLAFAPLAGLTRTEDK